MLADNILYLKKNYPALFNVMKDLDFQDKTIEVSLETAKNNEKTVNVKIDGKQVYLHSRYDPIRESKAVIDKLVEREQIDEHTHVVFFGVGLGYHIDAFAERFPDTEFSLYEPSPQLFSLFLDEKSLKSSSMKKMVLLHCECPNSMMDDFFKVLFIRVAEKNVVFMNLPIYEQLFAQQYLEFLDRFKKFVREKRMNLHTEFRFQKDWTNNSVENLKRILNTPNILMEHGDRFKGKPVIIVSAGPSLDYEIENLRKIKEEGLAFLFSVGSAINTLLNYEIYPDAICGFDATNDTLVYKKLIDSGITGIPMIFGSRIGPVVLEEYQGPKYHMLLNVDQINLFFLKDREDREMKLLIEAPSIAIIILQLVHFMECSPVILVGQNFSYLDNKNYAKGIDYYATIDPDTKNGLETTLDVNGNEVLTDTGYNAMRRQMEAYIEKYNMTVFNTTVGGAAIRGADFMPMEMVIEQLITKKVVHGDEFEDISEACIYDRDYLTTKIEMMENAFKQYHDTVLDIKKLILKIRPLIKNNNRSQTEVMYNKLDRKVISLEENIFFSLMAMPTNQVHYYYLLDQTDKIKTEKNMFEKIRLYIEQLDLFMKHLNDDDGDLTELINDLTSYKYL